MSRACYAYEKCLLGSMLTTGITESITRHVETIIRQQKAIFVGFKEIILQNMDVASSETEF